MVPNRRGIVILLGVLWSTLPRTASADVCEVDLTVETSDLGQTYRLIVGETGGGLALCLAPEPSDEDALALAEEPRVVAHVAATEACVTTTDSRAASRRDPFTLLEVVVAGHNVVLDSHPDRVECVDPEAVAPPEAGDGRRAILTGVGEGPIDVEILNLEDDSTMGAYAGPPVEDVADGVLAGGGPGGNPCSIGSCRNAYYGRYNTSTTEVGVCAWTPNEGQALVCRFVAPSPGNVYILGNSQDNTIRSPSSGIACVQGANISPWYSQWTARPILYGYAGADSLYGAGMWSVIHAGAGDDLIEGSSGPDFLYGEEGCDTVFGGAGDDVLYGGPDNDYLDGETNLNPGLYYDEIYGGDGRDFMHYAFLCDGEGPEDDQYGDWTWGCGSENGDFCCMSCQTDCRNALPTNF